MKSTPLAVLVCVAILASLSGCWSEYGAPPASLEPEDLVGVWVHPGDDGEDGGVLVLNEDGSASLTGIPASVFDSPDEKYPDTPIDLDATWQQEISDETYPPFVWLMLPSGSDIRGRTGRVFIQGLDGEPVLYLVVRAWAEASMYEFLKAEEE